MLCSTNDLQDSWRTSGKCRISQFIICVSILSLRTFFLNLGSKNTSPLDRNQGVAGPVAKDSAKYLLSVISKL